MTYFTINDPEEPVVFEEHRDDIAKQEEAALENQRRIQEEKAKALHDDDDSAESSGKEGGLKTIVFWICGIESQLKTNRDSQTTNETPPVVERVDTSIEEDKFWARICDLNAIIAMSCMGFFLAFFNRFD